MQRRDFSGATQLLIKNAASRATGSRQSLKAADQPQHAIDINTVIDGNPSAVRTDDLNSTAYRFGRLSWCFLDYRGRHKPGCRTEPSFPVQPAPREYLLARDAVPSRRCRGHPRARKALRDDPQLLLIRPAPSASGIDHFEPTDLMPVTKDIHSDYQLLPQRFTQGGLQRVDTPLRASLPYLRCRRQRREIAEPPATEACPKTNAACLVNPPRAIGRAFRVRKMRMSDEAIQKHGLAMDRLRLLCVAGACGLLGGHKRRIIRARTHKSGFVSAACAECLLRSESDRIDAMPQMSRRANTRTWGGHSFSWGSEAAHSITCVARASSLGGY